MLKLKPETEFKDTDFGKIPKDWEIANLGDESKFLVIMGQSPPSKYYNREGKGTPFAQGKKEFGDLHITPTIFTTKCSKIAPSNSVLITVRAPVGELNLTKSELCIGRGIAAILNKSGNPLHNRFIYYALKALSEYLSMLGERGTTYDSVRKEELDSVSFPYPQPSEQERIASVLSWFDDLIENKKRQNEVLEKTAMAIFKSWFIDFEPFKDGEFVTSEFGEIPKECDLMSLEEVATLYKGVSYSSSDISPEPQGNLFITLNNFLREGGFKLEYDYYIGSKAKEKHKVKEGDLIIALTDMTPLAKVVGSPAIVSLPYGHNFGVISLDCGKLQPHKECLRFYLYLYLKHTQEENSTFANGVNVLHLNTNLFMRNKLVLIPPEPILEKFHSLVGPLFKKIAINQKQILILRGIRDTLLPLLIFGRLRVEEI
jgi:type I restriction enzyme S subunit